MTLTLKLKKCGCLYEMKFYIHHLQNFSIKGWPWPWNWKSVVASMRWNLIFIICKIFGIKEWPCTWNRKSAVACLYEMKFYIHHLRNFRIQEWPYPWNWKSVVASLRWNSIFIIYKILVYKNDPDPEFRKVWSPLW